MFGFFKKEKKQEKIAPDGFFTHGATYAVEHLKDYESYLCAASGKLWASWKASDIIGTHVKNTPYIIKNTRGNTVNNPKLNDLLQKPNQYESLSDLLYKIALHIEFTGNAFIYKAAREIGSGLPEELLIMNPKYVRIVGHPRKRIERYEYVANGAMLKFDPDEVIHIKQPHPNNEFWGLGTIEASEILMQTNVNQNSSTDAFYKNGAQPSAVMMNEDFGGTQADLNKVKQKHESNFDSPSKAGRILWLTGSWKYTPLGISARESQQFETLQMTTEQIFLAHGVPLEVAGIKESDFAGAEAAMARFKATTILKHLRRIEDRLNCDLVRPYRKDLTFEFQKLGMVPLTQLAEGLTPFIDRSVLTPNQVRSIIGLAPDSSNPLGDKYLINQALLPADLAGMAQSLQMAQSQLSRPSESVNSSTQQRDQN